MDSAVHKLRANHRMSGETIHTAPIVPSTRSGPTRISTADSHHDTPDVQDIHRVIPRFHNAYYCYSYIYLEFFSEEGCWGHP